MNEAPIIDLPTEFPAARYLMEFEVVSPFRLPEYAGSTLRGVFGHSLRNIGCATRMVTCAGCPLAADCAYNQLFEAEGTAGLRRKYSRLPNPFVIEPPGWGARRYEAGEKLRFGFVLLGDALRHLQLVVSGWRHAMLGSIGPDRGRARLARIRHEQDPEWRSPDEFDRWRQPRGAIRLDNAGGAPDTATIAFDTPLRIKREGAVLGPEEITPRDLVAALVRRTADVLEFNAGIKPMLNRNGSGDCTGGIEMIADLRWQDWHRYSNRQCREMPLGGVVGQARLGGRLQPIWPLLYLGQWLHLGGKTTFGLGRYTLRRGDGPLERPG
ncbi:MAG: CRISPR system precrRNA processing endoribonuclease RAMP protein Cas6 [Burkholderiaceae bacterium]|nr:CRISPR system precrRNA processing endoribonuclease RAMP protein Cas6 [Burkholderiaceae bacterium]